MCPNTGTKGNPNVFKHVLDVYLILTEFWHASNIDCIQDVYTILTVLGCVSNFDCIWMHW
jgi:hypothetical protein